MCLRFRGITPLHMRVGRAHDAFESTLWGRRHSKYSLPFQVRPMVTREGAACTSSGSSDFVDFELDQCGLPYANEEKQDPLGVKREAHKADVMEKFSRLNIPLAQSEALQSLKRPNSRSADVDDEINPDNSLYQEEEDDLRDSKASDEHPLPYDDELYAEMLLKMEVEGSIDEAWQDTRKAHIEDVIELVEVLRSLKVRDICALDTSSKTGNFDYIIFGTCEGPRHIHLAAWAAQEADSLKRVSKISRKQTDHTWEVVPIGRIVVNLMQESLRDELSLERKWTVTKSMDPLTAANAPVSEGRHVKAHGLWTLTLNLQDLEDFEVDYCKDVLMRQL